MINKSSIISLSLFASLSVSAQSAIEIQQIHGVSDNWSNTNLSAEAKNNAIILAQTVTYNGVDAGNIRLSNDASQLHYQEWDTGAHTSTESVNIIAIKDDLNQYGIKSETFSIDRTDGDFTVNFKNTYSHPLGFAQLRTFKGGDSTTVELKSITANSATFTLVESTYEDGPHTTETIDILIIEQGTYTIDGVNQLIAQSAGTLNKINLSSSEQFNNSQQLTSSLVCQIQPINNGCNGSCGNAESAIGDYNGVRLELLRNTDNSISTINTSTLYPVDSTEQNVACLIADINMSRKDGVVTVYGSEGHDRIDIESIACSTDCSGNVDGSADANVNITYNDIVVPYKNVNEVRVYAGAGYDVIEASKANIPSYLYGEAGEDLLYASSSKTELYGGDDNDNLYLYASRLADTLIDCGQGSDSVRYTNAKDRRFFTNRVNCQAQTTFFLHSEAHQLTLANNSQRSSLSRGESMISPDGSAELKVETYRVAIYKNGQLAWSINPSSPDGSSHVIGAFEFADNGDLRIVNSYGMIVWQTDYNAPSGAFVQLTLDNDGSISADTTLKTLWTASSASDADFSPKVTIYQHCNYQGYAIEIPIGQFNDTSLKSMGMRNDDISSIKVPSGVSVQLYEHGNFSGSNLLINNDRSCLKNSGFNDKMSSMKVW